MHTDQHGKKVEGALTPSLSHRMGEGGRRPGEGSFNPYHNHTSACFPGKELAAREPRPQCRKQQRRGVTTKYTNYTKGKEHFFVWFVYFVVNNVICGCGISRAGFIRVHPWLKWMVTA
jgi:hypothetical protein